MVSIILARIVATGNFRLRSVYNPARGSGSLLLRVGREVKNVEDFYGQDLFRTTYNLALMNMILHGVYPQHEGMLFEAIVANPTFSAKWSANKIIESDDRFSECGSLAPGSKADFAFAQHMLHHLDEDGTMAVVLSHGVLFRSGVEGAIREFLVGTRNWLDAVIGLPANVFCGTGIPTCILIFKKRKEMEDILFVDASTCFEKGKHQNNLRDEDVVRIVETYRMRAEDERFSHRAILDKISENDFNLNIPRYVDTFEPEPEADLEAVTTRIHALNGEMAEAGESICAFCTE